jgi:DNA-binding transcriptional LysR family regulator
MAPIDLNLVRAFAAVHETGSFSLAAARLSVPRSSVSRAIAALEEEVGAGLFHRTTRRVTTTDEGRALFARVAPSLGELEDVLRDLPDRPERPSGTLRVTTAVDLGSIVMAEGVARYRARFPDVVVETLISNTIIDLVKEGYDLALRIAPVRLRTLSLIARRVGTVNLGLYASPTYLARRGTPRSFADLRDHDAVVYRGAAGPPPGRPRVVTDDMFFARELLRRDAGIGVLPSYLAADDVAAGALARVVPRWTTATGGIYLVHPSRKHVPTRVTAFRDLLVELLRQRPLR